MRRSEVVDPQLTGTVDGKVDAAHLHSPNTCRTDAHGRRCTPKVSPYDLDAHGRRQPVPDPDHHWKAPVNAIAVGQKVDVPHPRCSLGQSRDIEMDLSCFLENREIGDVNPAHGTHRELREA